MPSLSDTLTQAGLDPSMANIYVYLAESGEQGVPAIQAKTNLSRAGVYDALNFLLAQDYVEYRKAGRNAYYKAVHPNKLFGLVEERKRETALLAKDMEESIRALTGSYNLTINKPGVRFFEGLEGIKTVLWDSLVQANSTIYTIGDLEMWIKQCTPLNAEYLNIRKEKNINLQQLPNQFNNCLMEIYEDKISFITYVNDNWIGIIIQEKQIHDIIKTMFDVLWVNSISATGFSKTAT